MANPVSMAEAARLWLLMNGGEVRSIFIRDFAVRVSIGIHDFEKAAPQRVLVNAELFLRPAPPPGSDDIAEVLDYDFIRRQVLALVEGRHFNLQETLLDGIMAICLEPESVLAARVSTAKPDVYPDCAAVGLEAFKLKTPPT
ncbi:MAG TPA: dihydroneopterin aldolase [Azospirillaceae bacterium]|nr:dihydroneopterin aldolase [Azospirillaceae bacterium]